MQLLPVDAFEPSPLTPMQKVQPLGKASPVASVSSMLRDGSERDSSRAVSWRCSRTVAELQYTMELAIPTAWTFVVDLLL